MVKDFAQHHILDNTAISVRNDKSNIMSAKKVIELSAGLLIMLFIYTALAKLLDYQIFKAQLSKSPLITEFANAIAIGLPVVEIVIVTLLVFERTRLTGFYASFFLMMLFTSYIAVMLKFSYYIPCSCGGVLKTLTWNQHLLFNTIYIAISLVGLVVQTRYRAEKSP